MKYLLDLIGWKARYEKPVIIISSYGWGGVAGRVMKDIMERHGYRVVDVVEFSGSPSIDDLKAIDEVLNKVL